MQRVLGFLSFTFSEITLDNNDTLPLVVSQETEKYYFRWLSAAMIFFKKLDLLFKNPVVCQHHSPYLFGVAQSKEKVKEKHLSAHYIYLFGYIFLSIYGYLLVEKHCCYIYFPHILLPASQHELIWQDFQLYSLLGVSICTQVRLVLWQLFGYFQLVRVRV